MNGSEGSFVSVAQFLEDLGLRQYSAVFKQEAVDFETLRELDDGDLRTLGLPLGHRKKILKAISEGLAPKDGGETEPELRRVSVPDQQFPTGPESRSRDERPKSGKG